MNAYSPPNRAFARWHGGLFALALVLHSAWAHGQVVGNYFFSQTNETYTTLFGGATPAAAFATAWDDGTVLFNLPFNFTYNNVVYTQVRLSTNGFLTFGGGTTANGVGAAYVSFSDANGVYLSGTALGNGVAFMNMDLAEATFATFTATRTAGSATLTGVSSFANVQVGTRLSGTGIQNGTIINAFDAGAGTITMSTTATASGTTALTPRSAITGYIVGTAPFRSLVFQFHRARRFGVVADDINVQVWLNEDGAVPGNQSIFVRFGPNTAGVSNLAGIGIRTTTADFVSRTTSTNWSATTAAVVNTDRCTYAPGVVPASGLQYRFGPATCAFVAGSYAFVNAGCDTYEVTIDVTGTGDSPGAVVDIEIDGITQVAGAGIGSYGPFGPFTNGSTHLLALVHLGNPACSASANANSTVSCNDNDPTTNDYCLGNVCFNDPIPCDDGDPQTINDVLVLVPGGTTENFDAVTAPALPAGWLNQNLTGTVHPWTTSTTFPFSNPNSAYYEQLTSTTSDNVLVTPPINIVSTTAQLSFQNSHWITDIFLGTYYDGAVLEISINAGAWTDIIAAGGAWVTGGYSHVLAAGTSNPLQGRAAWAGISAGGTGNYFTTTVDLPAAAAGQSIQLRWRYGTDNLDGAGSDWLVDNVQITDFLIDCAGVPNPCTEDLFFVHNNTTNYQDLVWTIHDQTDDSVVETGGINPGEGSVPLCLPDGCYYLRVTNSGGNVISGGYRLVLKDAVGAYGNARIIDDTDNLVLGPGGDSGISGNEGFCIPLGTDEPIYTSCDRYWWSSGDYLVGKENLTVSAEFGGPNASSSGYEFWFYDPNGGLSFRKTRVHTVSDGFAPNNAVRACHIKLNNWAAASHLQNGVLYNVRSRGVVAGNPLSEFGPACRVTLDPVLAACPPTGLNDIPGNPNFSCGVNKKFGGPNQVANRLFARPVAGANLYEWEFTNDPNEPAYYVTRQTTGVQRHLNWPASQGDPMLVGNTYRVRVRASKDGGANWCDWGWTCEVTIIPSAAPGNENMALEGDAASNLALWPNPNNGQQVWITLDELAAEVGTVAVDLYDLSGKRVMAREIATQGGHLYTNIDLGGLAAGTYLVTITAGDEQHVRRLVVQP
ncbi:MAG: T9SS type A sorting domain-containing protein [Flavobacteriales bacterium]|nr:T9SS type A sorting domain-containing protein [Flavobacteriales bacterium]